MQGKEWYALLGKDYLKSIGNTKGGGEGVGCWVGVGGVGDWNVQD